MKKITIPVATTANYLQFWNGLFNMTPKELKILELFIETADTVHDLCAIRHKVKVAEELGLKDKDLLNVYIKKLKDKKALVKGVGIYSLNKLLDPNNKNVQVSIRWRE